MSDDIKKKADYTTKRISALVKDLSVSKLVQDTLIDILEDQEETTKLLFDLENQIRDIKENLKDSSAHKMK